MKCDCVLCLLSPMIAKRLEESIEKEIHFKTNQFTPQNNREELKKFLNKKKITKLTHQDPPGRNQMQFTLGDGNGRGPRKNIFQDFFT